MRSKWRFFPGLAAEGTEAFGRHRIEGRACERMVLRLVDVRAFDDGLEEYLKEIEAGG